MASPPSPGITLRPAMAQPLSAENTRGTPAPLSHAIAAAAAIRMTPRWIQGTSVSAGSNAQPRQAAITSPSRSVVSCQSARNVFRVWATITTAASASSTATAGEAIRPKVIASPG